MSNEGSFLWSTSQQGYVLSSFFYGYVITQIPFGILSKKYGAKYFLGVGMLINSVFGFLVPLSANFGIVSLITIRFIQGLGEVSVATYVRAPAAGRRVNLYRRVGEPKFTRHALDVRRTPEFRLRVRDA